MKYEVQLSTLARMTLYRASVRIALGFILALGALVAFAVGDTWDVTGARASGARLERMQRSPHWNTDHFRDVLPRHQAPFVEMSRQYFFGGSAHRNPEAPLPVLMRSAADFRAPPADPLTVTWLGHSTLLVEMDGHRLLVDPVWSERASPFTWAGPARFYPPPLPLSELPPIDAIIISHDHYDHLDASTVAALAQQTRAPFLVPLGVGAHLEHWGIAPERIVELDWWQEHRVGELALVATPARHFSGRSILMADKDATLWAGWAFIGPKHRVYYSGDTAMFPGFTDIGERLGPFDATLIECGAYSSLWADVHLGPEQAVTAHRMAQGGWLIPVHWGLFDLALHGWTEPIERVLVAARAQRVVVATPAPGQTLEVRGATPPESRWWPQVPWVPASEAPVTSSGLMASAVPAR